jgi:outer membrane protein
MKKLFLSTTITALLLIFGKPVSALDFLQAYELAEKNDPEILAASYAYQAVLGTRSQSRSALLPNVTLNLFTQQVSQDSNDPTTITSDYTANGYDLSLTQSIYNHDIYLILEQTDLSIASAAANYNAEKQTLIIRVADAYYSVLAAGDNLAFARAEKKAIYEQLEQTKKRFEVGLIAITDVKESQAQYDLSIALEIQADNLLLTTRETLRSIIGEFTETLNVLAKNIPLIIPVPAAINQWVDTAKKNNLSLKSAQYSYEIANKQISIDRAGHYPSLNLNLSRKDSSLEIENGTNLEKEDTTISLNLSIPVYSGGLTSAKTRAAVAKKERARALREKALRSTIKLSRDSYLGVTTSIAQVKAFKQALISTQSAYEATQAGFEAGTRTTVDVLSVLREQYKAERDYAKVRYEYILNVLRLKQAAGILSKQDVVEVNQWLEE